MTLFDEAANMDTFEAADRLVKPASPAGEPPASGSGSMPVAAPAQTTATFDPDGKVVRFMRPLTVGELEEYSAKVVDQVATVVRQGLLVAKCSCGREYTALEFLGLSPAGYAGRLGATHYYELRTCECGDPISRLVTR